MITFSISRYLEGTYHVSLATEILPQINTIVKKCLLGLKEVRLLQINGMFSVMSKVASFLFSKLSSNRRPVSSVGRASHYRAGGLGFEPLTGPTLRVLK